MTRRVCVKRVYEPAGDEDGVRVLVDRLWPRGLKRSEANLDCWLKEVAPSSGLRRWFSHRADRWIEFKRRYLKELRRSAALRALRELSASRDVTLLYAAKDDAHSHALVLAGLLRAAPREPSE